MWHKRLLRFWFFPLQCQPFGLGSAELPAAPEQTVLCLHMLLPLPKITFLAFSTWLTPTYPLKLTSNIPPLEEAF